MKAISEDILEQTTLSWLSNLGWSILHGPNIAPEMPDAERENFRQVILIGRLHDALARINPTIPTVGIEEAVRKIIITESPDLIVNNRHFHRYLTDGIDVEIPADNGQGGTRHDKVWLLDLESIDNNDWLALNQFTVIEEQKNRRPDVVLFVNGLPLALLELKNPGAENATIKHAFNQFETYKNDIPAFFTYNSLLVISDGVQSRSGTLTSGWDRYMPWRTIDGVDIARKGTPESGDMNPGT